MSTELGSDRLLIVLGELIEAHQALISVAAEMSGRIEDLEALVKGRNRSAPIKRNMTDEDAVQCAMGDVRDMDHKQAAEQLGLTYAQVYSFRLGYTFKHVLKDLRDNGWDNPWVKSQVGVHRIKK